MDNEPKKLSIGDETKAMLDIATILSSLEPAQIRRITAWLMSFTYDEYHQPRITVKKK